MRRLTFGGDATTGLDLLAIGAHADDIEIGCAGTLLRLVAEGRVSTVCWVVLSGDAERASEAKAGASAILADVEHQEVIVREGRDGFFPLDGVAIKEFFEELKTRVDPDVIFTHRLADRHQDHRFVAELTWQTFRDHLILEYEIPKYDGDLGMPNVYFDVPEWAATRKLEIVSTCFPSQSSRPWFAADTFRSLLRMRAIESRATSGYAEAFEGRKIVF